MNIKNLKVTLRQPRTLQLQLCSQLIQLIAEKSARYSPLVSTHLFLDPDFDKTQQLRDYFQILPVTVRSLLFSLRTSSVFTDAGYNWYAEDYNDFVFTLVLISSQTQCLDYAKFGPREHFGSFRLEKQLNFLISETKNLEKLTLPLPKWWSDQGNKIPSLLTDLIHKNNLLTHLELPSVVCDTTIEAIGRSCHHLLFLDISHNKRITDHAICYLTQIWDSETETSVVKGEMDKHFLRFYPSLLGNSTKHLKDLKQQILTCRVSVTRTKLCETLKILRLEETSVTVKGLSTSLALIDNLLDVGARLDELIDELYESYEQREENDFEFPNWNLRSVRLNDLTENRLQMLRLLFKNAVRCLSVPYVEQHQDILNNYLSECGESLTHLKLTRTCELDQNIYLSVILKYCPNLEKLSIQDCFKNMAEHIDALLWGEENTPVLTPTLKHVDLITKVSCQTAQLLLESAPSLKEVRFGLIEDGSNFLELLSQSLYYSKELTKFVIFTGDTLDDPLLLSSFWLLNQNIKSIGYVKYNVRDLTLGDNIDLKLLRKEREAHVI